LQTKCSMIQAVRIIYERSTDLKEPDEAPHARVTYHEVDASQPGERFYNSGGTLVVGPLKSGRVRQARFFHAWQPLRMAQLLTAARKCERYGSRCNRLMFGASGSDDYLLECSISCLLRPLKRAWIDVKVCSNQTMSFNNHALVALT
jgi:hypothetical protein